MRILIDFGRDVAAGVRLLHRYRGFSTVAILTLAAAIGGNATVFTIVNALLLTPPPVAEPARLAVVYTGQSLTSWQTYEDLRDRADAFTAVSAHRMSSLSLARDGANVRLRGLVTSPNYLTVLGVPAERGRIYREGDAVVDGVVLGHHVWRQYFGADPDIVGRPIVLGGRSLVVAGVMPRGFRGLAPPGREAGLLDADRSSSRGRPVAQSGGVPVRDRRPLASRHRSRCGDGVAARPGSDA